MPPYYDVYGLSKERNKQTIEEFLDYYSYRDKIENQENQGIGGYSIKDPEKQVCIPIRTLTEVIDFGVANRDHCFVFYIGDHLKAGIAHIILKFTSDAQIIFGISVEENRVENNGDLSDNYDTVLKIEKQIATLTHAAKTSIQFEYPPAVDEDEFDKDIELWQAVNMEKQNKYNSDR